MLASQMTASIASIFVAYSILQGCLREAAFQPILCQIRNRQASPYIDRHDPK